MALITFEDLPSTNTPLNAANLNNNFTECNNIVESGSNANGNYIKYNDGTLICWKYVSGTTPCNTAWGSLYETSAIELGPYPVNFIRPPYLMITPNMNAGALCEGVQNSSTSSFGKVWLARAGSSNSLNYGLDCVAIGKWK